MVKPENVISVRSRKFSRYSDFTLKCEDCGKEYHRAVLNNRTRPYCAACYKNREKQRQYDSHKNKLNAAYQKGYDEGFKAAVKAYQERDEMIQ